MPWNDAYRYGLCFIQKLSLKSQIIQGCFKNLRLSNVGTFFFPAGRPNSRSVSPSGKKPCQCQIFLSPAWAWPGTRPGLDQNLCASKTASPLKSPEASKFPWDQPDQPPPWGWKWMILNHYLHTLDTKLRCWIVKKRNKIMRVWDTDLPVLAMHQFRRLSSMVESLKDFLWMCGISKNSVFIGFTKTKLSALAHTQLV